MADLQRTEGHDADVGQLVQRRHQVLRALGDRAHLQVVMPRLVGGLQPARQHAPATLAGLDRLGALDALDQQPGLEVLRRGAHLRQTLDPAAEDQARRQPEHQEEGGDQCDRSADGGQHRQRQQRQRNVDDDLRGNAHQEAAHRLVTAQPCRGRPDTGRQLVQAQREETRVDRARQALVDRVGHAVEQVRAHPLAQHLEQDGQGHADAQHQQRRLRLRRHHAVVDLHRIEGGAQRQQADRQRAGRDVEQAALLAEDLCDDELEGRAAAGDEARGEAPTGEAVPAIEILFQRLGELPGAAIPPTDGPFPLGIARRHHAPAPVG